MERASPFQLPQLDLVSRFAPPAPEATPSTTHTLSRQGDTLASLAFVHGVAEQTLRAFNPDIPPFDVLSAETRVALPPADAPAPDASDDVHDAGDGLAAVRDVAGPDGTTPPPLTPAQARAQIEALPEPSVSDLPPQLPPEDRQQIFAQRQAIYEAQVLAIAESAVTNGQPPLLSDYADAPPAVGRMAYGEALQQYQADVSALRGDIHDIRMGRIESDASFQALPQATQDAISDAIRFGEFSPDTFDLLGDLATRIEFPALAPDRQLQLVALASGTGQAAFVFRDALENLLDANRNVCFDPQQLDTLLTESRPMDAISMLDGAEGLPPPTFGPGEYTVTGPQTVENYDFHSGDADALRYEVRVDGQTIPVYVPADPDSSLHYHDIEQVATALAALPPDARASVGQVEVNPGQNPQDAQWAVEYDSPGFRSYMTAGGEGVINIYPTESAPAQGSLNTGMIHESGHIAWYQDFDTDQHAAWEDAMSADGVEVSAYGNNSTSEDFAESYALYLRVQGTPDEATLRAVMPERFEMLDALFAR